MTAAVQVPQWFRLTPAGAADAVERERQRRDLHGRLIQERAAVEAESTKSRPTLAARAEAAAVKSAAAAARARAEADVAREAAHLLRAHDLAVAKRLAILDVQLRATAPPVLEAFAEVLAERVVHLRMGRVAAPVGAGAADTAMQLQALSQQLREVVPLLSSVAAEEELARIIGAVSLTLIAAPPSRLDHQLLEFLERLKGTP